MYTVSNYHTSEDKERLHHPETPPTHFPISVPPPMPTAASSITITRTMNSSGLF